MTEEPLGPEPVVPAGPVTLEVRRPADGGTLGRLPVAGAMDVADAVARARRAQAGWSSLAPGDRFRRLRALAPVLADAAEDVATRIQEETGKPRVEGLTEVVVALELVRYYARVGPSVFRRQRRPVGWLLGRSAWTVREPYGVVGVITPWNYPFLLAMDAVVTAVAAGNAVVLKPSEFTPLTALEIPGLVRAARLPASLVEVVVGDGSTGGALVRSGVDRVSFTGGPSTGRKVMAAAADTLTPVTLELGGKDPALVLEDADLARAVPGVVFGAFFNAGQTCLSTERVYVVDALHDTFVERAARAVAAVRTGTGGEYDVGPMTTPAQLEIVERHVRSAVAAGARVVVGGGRVDPASNLLQPTLMVDVEDEMDIVREETFGPVLPVIRVADEEEAVRRANAHPLGLFASVWTGSRARGEAVALRLNAGGVSINDTLSHYGMPAVPMGGVGESGFGRARGVEGLLEMSRTRAVVARRFGPTRDPWWFPYGEGSLDLIRGLIRWRGRGEWVGLATAARGLLDRLRR